jgi:predicted extracellular nuclease
MTDHRPLHPVPLRLVIALALALPLSLLLATPATAAVVISQVYGGGGNSGATYKNDFIELFNNGSDAVSVSGWSVQYGSAAGTGWSATALPNVTLQPGQYLLVQETAGTGGTTSLPTPDAIGTLSLSGSSGKVALVSSTAALTGTAPTGAAVKDLVSYGSTATGAETSPAPGLSNTTAALRAFNGCQDSNDNSADFSAAAPAPRNSASALAPCDGSTGTPPTTPPEASAKAAEIYAIQGSGATSPMAGERVITSGVVTKLASNGFYLQALQGDGDPATSDALFVYTGSVMAVGLML